LKAANPLFNQVSEVESDPSRRAVNLEVQALLNDAAGVIECATAATDDA
jgi:hypothetical protein